MGVKCKLIQTFSIVFRKIEKKVTNFLVNALGSPGKSTATTAFPINLLCLVIKFSALNKLAT